MPRGVPKSGFRKTKNWQKRQEQQDPPKKKVAAPKDAQLTKPGKKVSKNKPTPKKPTQTQAKTRKSKKTEKKSSPADSTVTSGRSKFLRHYELRMEEYDSTCCTTRIAYVEDVGHCDFCVTRTAIRVMVISSRKQRPKTEIKMCRKCLSKCAMDRLEV